MNPHDDDAFTTLTLGFPCYHKDYPSPSPPPPPLPLPLPLPSLSKFSSQPRQINQHHDDDPFTALTLGFPCYHKNFTPSPHPPPLLIVSPPPPAREDSHPLHPWAMAQPYKVHSYEYLLKNRITRIRGDLRCTTCQHEFQIELDLGSKFSEVGNFICSNKESMNERAPASWLKPSLPTCLGCHQDTSEPVIDSQNDGYNINWLFLLLAQLLGHCTLNQLKLFCKTHKIHRTGAKDRLLYLAYLNLCKQLDPSGPFDR